MTAKLRRYPLDFSALRKGDVIEGDSLLEAIGCDPTDERFALACLRLAKQAEDQTEFVVRYDSKHKVVRVLTDEETHEWTKSALRRNVRGIGRQAQRRTKIDTSELSSEQRRIVESETMLGASVYLVTIRELNRNKIVAPKTLRPKRIK